MTRVEFSFPAAQELHPEVKAFMEEIVHAIVGLFGTSEDEAVGRVTRHWGHVTDFGEPMPSNSTHVEVPSLAVLLMREEPEHWAKDIYYGPDSGWWNDEGGVEPLPYP
jgi:hypothetical protein